MFLAFLRYHRYVRPSFSVYEKQILTRNIWLIAVLYSVPTDGVTPLRSKSERLQLQSNVGFVVGNREVKRIRPQ